MPTQLFKPGNPGGPGRPRGRITKFRKLLAGLTDDGKEIAEELIGIWRDHDNPPKERREALVVAMHYLLGKPETAVTLDVTARPGLAIDGHALLARLPDELVERVVKELDGDDAPLQLPPSDGDDDE